MSIEESEKKTICRRPSRSIQEDLVNMSSGVYRCLTTWSSGEDPSRYHDFGPEVCLQQICAEEVRILGSVLSQDYTDHCL